MENKYMKNIVTFRTIFYKFLLMFTNVLINYNFLTFLIDYLIKKTPITIQLKKMLTSAQLAGPARWSAQRVGAGRSAAGRVPAAYRAAE